MFPELSLKKPLVRPASAGCSGGWEASGCEVTQADPTGFACTMFLPE